MKNLSKKYETIFSDLRQLGTYEENFDSDKINAMFVDRIQNASSDQGIFKI